MFRYIVPINVLFAVCVKVDGTDCDTNCTQLRGKSASFVYLQLYDMFGFETSLPEAGGKMCIKGAARTDGPDVKLYARKSDTTKLITEGQCLNYEASFTANYILGEYRMEFGMGWNGNVYSHFQLCNPEETWISSCKAGRVCLKTHEHGVVCEDRKNNSIYRRELCNMQGNPIYKASLNETENTGRLYTFACPNNRADGDDLYETEFTYCDFMMGQDGDKVLKNPRDENDQWWIRILMKDQFKTECVHAVAVSVKDILDRWKPIVPFSATLLDLKKKSSESVVFANQGIDRDSVLSVVDLSSGNVISSNSVFETGHEPLSVIPFWKKSKPTTGMYHARLQSSVSRYSLPMRIYKDYILFNTDDLKIEWKQMNSCDLNMNDKFECEVTLPSYLEGVPGLRIELSAFESVKQKIYHSLVVENKTVKATQTTEVTPTDPEKTWYSCVAKLYYRFTNGRVHELVLAKKTLHNKFICVVGQRPDGSGSNSTAKEKDEDGSGAGRNADGSNASGNEALNKAETGFILGIVSVVCSILLSVGLVVFLLVFFLIILPGLKQGQETPAEKPPAATPVGQGGSVAGQKRRTSAAS